MSLDSRDLYQEIILDHYKNPCNFGTIENAKATGVYSNPSCGDEIQLQILIGENEKIEDIKFQGRGCAISQASASMMTETVKGKTTEEVQKIITDFQTLVTGQGETTTELGDLKALEGVKKFPLRVKCATLAWSALSDILNKNK